MLLFFDEINTNIHVDGLLKEIVIDRRVHGVALHPNILIVAACNPYQLKKPKALDEDDPSLVGVSAGF